MSKVINLNNQSEWLTFDDVLLLPNYSEVTPSKTDTATQLTEKIKLKIPILASPMDTVCESAMAIRLGRIGGYGIIHRNLSIEKQVRELKLVLKEGVKAGAAVGVGADFKARVTVLIKAGVKEICLDSAHGYTKHVLAAIQLIKSNYPTVEIIAGNAATTEGVEALFAAGAAAVKVGMGPGSICTTRIMSGMGVPQLAAIVAGAKAAKKYKKRIIADGGIRTSGDMVKALAAGADAVMLGSLLAGTDASPGKLVTFQGKKYKTYRGMGSVAAMKQGSAERYGQKKTDKKLVAEGVEGLVEYKGKLEDFVYQLIGGLRSGLAYLGAENLQQLSQKARFIRISRAGVHESRPHSILMLDR